MGKVDWFAFALVVLGMLPVVLVAIEHKLLGADRRNSTRRSAVHKNISRSWTALAHQLESLAVIEKEGT